MLKKGLRLLMKYRSVIFDLFGTLAENFSTPEYEEALVQMAAALSLPAADFKSGWYASARTRDADAPKDLEARVSYICAGRGTPRAPNQVHYAVRIRYDYIRGVMQPRPGAGEVLSRIKEKGLKIGLISDCSDEIPVIWPQTPLAPLFDATVFSCLAGFRKPDPRIYQLAAERLGVPAEGCLFVGDGGSQELSGALRAGMHPIMIRLDAESTEKHLVNREVWTGAVIHALPEILPLISED
jgi:putative hydrolase of the HAD superfamily